MSSSFATVALILLLACLAQGQLFLGDSCTLRGTGDSGTCRYDSDCPAARRQLLFGGVRPTICSFQGVQSIVCCVNDQAPSQPQQRPSQTQPPFRQPSQTNFNFNSNRGSQGRRISEQKCSEYSSRVTTTLEALPLLPDPEPLNFTVARCDYSSSPLIVGGTEADVGEFPHMAVIGWLTNDDRQYAWLCGGSLISENFVLTAGHCISFDRDTSLANPEPQLVRLGEHNLKSSNDGASPQDIDIAQIIKHPQYRSPIKYHDIALLRLARSASLNNLVRPACLWQEQTINQESCVATGWGKIDFAEDPSDVLLKVSLKVIQPNLCKSLFTTKNRNIDRGVIDEQLCAGDLDGGKDTCHGDSGGPLQVSDNSNRCIFRIIGVTSFGNGCGGRNTPAIYTRVSSYISWIESVVWP